MEQRLQKLIAAAGLCSRRRAEKWITVGRVCVNGTVASLGQSADPLRDDITVDGKPLRLPDQKRYLLLNKPRGYVCTLSDEKGRPTVAELVADCGTRVVPVGRLDYDSEGLLLLTNDGAWLHRVLHPKYEIEKEYHVTVTGQIDGAAERLSQMCDVDGEPIRPARVSMLHSRDRTATLSVKKKKKKNRQIRRMCAAAGLQVRRLCRVREHRLCLGDLPTGTWRELTAEELRDFNEG